MEILDIAKESTNEIYIDVEENNKEVEPSKEKAGESVSQSLESSLEKELAASINVHDDHFGFIYKVSEKYRKVKEECYTPRVVSIGPLHHGKSHLQAMEGYKLRCLNKLINEHGISLKGLSEFATIKEGLVRACYQDFKAKEFSKMILLDGIFIIVLIAENDERMRNVAATITLFENSWLASDVKHDMLLLENQLPFFFIAGLSGILGTKHNKSIFHDLLNYFKDVGITSRLEKNLTACEDALHLVDFLLDLHEPSSTESVQSDNERFENTRSASELHKAGVHFNPEDNEGLFAVSFDKSAGKLSIPQLTVNDTTDTFFRNLIAFEQCQHQKYITSYIIFMDSLIDTAEDVKLLVKHEIIVNSLGEDQLVADLFNNLHKEVIENGRDFYFAQICKDLNEYSKDYFHRWKSSCFKWKLVLKDRYFTNPWSVISLIAAIIVVVLTIVQTVYAIIGYEK